MQAAMAKSLGRVRAVFFDRDGTLIHERNYLNDPEKIRLFSRTVEAVRLLRRNGFFVIVTTNQSGVARGVISAKNLRKIHSRLRQLLKAGGARLDSIYCCPH